MTPAELAAVERELHSVARLGGNAIRRVAYSDWTMGQNVDADAWYRTVRRFAPGWPAQGGPWRPGHYGKPYQSGTGGNVR